MAEASARPRFSLATWIERLPQQPRGVALILLYGLAAASVAIAFQVAMTAVHRAGLVRLSHLTPAAFLTGSFVLTVGTAAFSGWLLTYYCREAAGSGIPQLKRGFWKDFGYTSWRVVWVKFVAGVLQIGGGSSLGREGPSVQLAAGMASQVATVMGQAKQRHRRAAATGAAAGLAAAFNTPLAAVTFVLEEIIGDLNSRLLGGILLAAMVGALAVHAILGPEPAFTLAPVGEPTWRAHLLVPIVAAAAAFVGAGFQKAALALRGTCRTVSRIPRWLQPALGATICWALGVAVFFQTNRLGVFGLGYEDLSDVLTGRVGWQIAAVLLVAKFIATVTCYGTGGCGGIFSPTLFFGAMAGLVVAGLSGSFVPLAPGGVALLAIVGMSASLGAVVRAPVTSILIVFEMTHDFALVPPLMLAALVSQAVSRRLVHENIYDALLAQDGQSIEHITLPRDLRAWQDQPVARFATTQVHCADSLEPDALSALLDRYPFSRFPVVEDGQIVGILPRQEAQRALRERRRPELRPANFCRPNDRVREVAAQLVESSAGIVLLQAAEHEKIAGVFTLHDLLRAQMAAADHHASLEA